MSSIDNITAKILSEAKLEAEQIKQEAAKEAEAIMVAATQEGEEAAQQIHQQAEIKAVSTRERLHASVDRQARDTVLSARQSVIERIFLLAEERLRDLSDDDYIASLKTFLKQIELEKGSVLLVPPRRKALLTDLDIPVQEDESITAGFKVIHNNIIDNYDYVELMNYRKEDLVPELVADLERSFETGEL